MITERRGARGKEREVAVQELSDQVVHADWFWAGDVDGCVDEPPLHCCLRGLPRRRSGNVGLPVRPPSPLPVEGEGNMESSRTFEGGNMKAINPLPVEGEGVGSHDEVGRCQLLRMPGDRR